MVSWSGLTSNANNSWNELASSLVMRCVKDLKVSVNNKKNIHHLSLVLVNSLDLNVIKSVKWNIISSVFLDPGLKFCLVLSLDLNETVLEILISGIRSKLLQVFKGSDPLIDSSKSVTD